MRKMKRQAAMILALTLTALSCFAPGMTARAEEQGTTALKEVTQPDSETEQAGGAEEKTGQGTGENVPAASSSNALEPDAEVDNSQIPAVMSLLPPHKEENAYLFLQDYSYDRLTNISVTDILSRLKRADGSSIQVPDDAKILMGMTPGLTFEDYYASIEDFNSGIGIASEEQKNQLGGFQLLDRGGNVDLSEMWLDDSDVFTLELIVGKGTQLDTSATWYHVKVYSSIVNEQIEYLLYSENAEGQRERVKAKEILSRESEKFGGVSLSTVFFVPETYEDGKTYYFGLESYIASRYESEKPDGYPELEVNIYSGLEVNSGAPVPQNLLTSQMLGEENVRQSGHPGQYPLEISQNADNIFFVTYTEKKTGKMLGIQGIRFVVCPEEKAHVDIGAKIYLYDNGELTDIVKGTEENNWENVAAYDEWSVGIDGELDTSLDGTRIKYITLLLNRDYHTETGTFLFGLTNEHIKRVIVGRNIAFTGLESKEGNSFTLPDGTVCPYGLDLGKMIYNGYTNGFQYLKVFFDDETYVRYYIRYRVASEDTSETESPRADLWMKMTGAAGYEGKTYVVENSLQMVLDSLNGDYQTVFINDTGVDMTSVRPIFETADSVQVNAGSLQTSGRSRVDFSGGPVLYTAHIGDQIKNYVVDFVKKEQGAKLYVNGPVNDSPDGENMREVYLNVWEGSTAHDILIANVGDAPLTGLKVELSADAQNVALDSYWTVGGTDNDTIPAFDLNAEGKMTSLAKIRLLPDYFDENYGAGGPISGTLTVTADGQDPVYIRLTGYSGASDIETDELDPAVKYVPYSYMIATNNMDETNEVTFRITDGELPDGLTLRETTGEIYGTPLVTGEFTFTVTASYSQEEQEDSIREFTLIVQDNTNDVVFNASDEGYEVETYIGTETVAGSHDYVLSEISDQLFVSSGEYAEFVDVWLNGEKLVRDADYTAESGSTRITVRAQTFRTKANLNGNNTIAAEFRTRQTGGGTSGSGGSGSGSAGSAETTGTLKRTAQNFRMNVKETDSGSTGGSGTGSGSGSGSSGGSGSGGSGSGSGSSGGSSSGRSSGNVVQKVNPPLIYNGDMSLYSDSYWVENETGWWYRLPDGTWPAGQWCRLPYQSVVEWYYFDENGYMVTGWFTDADGSQYYLSPVSDGLKGHMVVGWQQIDGNWHYFKEESDGTRGSLQTNTWIGEYYVNRNGIWRE